MSVTDHLDNYMRIHKCKMADIARLSGIPYTTLKGFYDKGDDNVKLSTLKKLRTLLNCTLDELAGVQSSDSAFTYEEKLLLSKFRNLDDAAKKAVLLSIDTLILADKSKTAETPQLEEKESPLPETAASSA